MCFPNGETEADLLSVMMLDVTFVDVDEDIFAEFWMLGGGRFLLQKHTVNQCMPGTRETHLSGKRSKRRFKKGNREERIRDMTCLDC